MAIDNAGAQTNVQTNAQADPQRRKLLVATIGAGGVGAVAAAIPFVASMAPSEAAKAAGAPVEVDVTQVAPGKLVTVEYRGKPIWGVHRTDAMLQMLRNHDHQLADPQSDQPQQPPYAKTPARSIKPPFFI